MNRITLLLLLNLLLLPAKAQRVTLKMDAQKTHQRITGFGGFVCSPQFTYNHMSAADIKKVWGTGSTVGCNIMRLYIPIGRNAWSQSLATAKNAKQMGLIVFASPWGQPAEWKTNGTSNAKNSDGTEGRLKRENWADYAQYLEDYVQYMRKNGVELDAISIQNEPDWPASYAGCLWSASEIAEFVKTYGRQISCKIMAPETLAVNDSYANALNKSDVIDCFDIYGGHQYGGIQSAYKQLGKKGKELWMTEYLINWNEAENNTRNFDFTKDFFNFFTAINTCLLGDFNAWVHYAAKRYYGMLGDGQRGTTTGVVTKRGYIMAHFARFVTGMTRIDATFNGGSLEGSAYLSTTGDTVVAVVANTGSNDVELVADLPFYTRQGKLYTTSKAKNFTQTTIAMEQETCRPTATLASQSVSTLLFVRSRDRQPSQMKGTTTRFDRLDDMAATKAGFGNTYKISGKTRTFDHSNPLLSTRTNASYGYIALNDRYSRLVMQVKKVTSTMNLTSSQTTLYYINSRGVVATHDYGEQDFSRRENFELVFDLSPQTLTDGCRGLLCITNNNWSSTLSITFGDVFLCQTTGAYAATLSGTYVEDDSYLLDYTSDPACTCIDLSATTGLPTTLPWLSSTNRVVFTPTETMVQSENAVIGNTCSQLSLSADGGPFRPARTFTADAASFSCEIAGARLLMLPFTADVPNEARAYAVGTDLSLQPLASIPAHQPVLVVAQGNVSFSGTGLVDYAVSPLADQLHGTYTGMSLFAGDYVLGRVNEQWGLVRLASSATLSPFDVYATPTSSADFIPFGSADGIAEATTVLRPATTHRYTLTGQRVRPGHKGIVVSNGRKYIQ